MNSYHKAKLQQRFIYMKDNISEPEVLVDHLVTMKTFSIEQRSQIILTNATARDNIQRLLDKLIVAGPKAFDNFLKALKNTGTGNCHVADVLEAEGVVSTRREDTFVIEKGSAEEVAENNEDQPSLKEITRDMAILKSQVKELYALKTEKENIEKELEKKEKECYQLKEEKEQLDATNKENLHKITELEERVKALEKELKAARLNIKHLDETLYRHTHEHKRNKNEIQKNSFVSNNVPEKAKVTTHIRKSKPPFSAATNKQNISKNVNFKQHGGIKLAPLRDRE